MTLYAVGDVQGCADELDKLLKKISFSKDRDHLWLVGDLVNRGPDSREVLRIVRWLGDAATCVLGNHDLHLLATYAGVRPPSASDTFDDVLDASDADKLIGWLRQMPLIHRDRANRRVLVHAGIPPVWKPAEAERQAVVVEELLRSRGWRKALRCMYGETPTAWSERLGKADRRRFTINALTRMRFCYDDGRLDFRHSGPPDEHPSGLVPWFDIPWRRGRKWHIVFGHWSALGLMQRNRLTAVDTGCIWGGTLTALPIEPAGEPIAVRCTLR
jgi:bis(5'-nucleosyl)-tetraphosphatase (symmetrical)